MPAVTKKQRLRDFIAARGWAAIGEAEWKELRTSLPDISETTLRSVGVPTAAPWSGVASHSLDDLETCLREMVHVYETRPDLQRYCRDQVIVAKDRARWASRNPRADEAARGMKAEMLDWMLVWLDDPTIFPEWVRVRRRRLVRDAQKEDATA